MKTLFGRLSTTAKVTLCVVCIICTELLGAHLLGLISSHRRQIIAGRAAVCETLAVNLTLLAMKDDHQTITNSLVAIQDRNASIASIALRRMDGAVVAVAGEHRWEPPADGHSTATQMMVPISSQAGRWGTVEVRFAETGLSLISAIAHEPLVRLLAFLIPVSLVVYYLLFRRLLKQLNPASVIPQRVRMALDTLTEGLLILDQDDQIMLANSSFGRLIDLDPDALLGVQVGQLPWCCKGSCQSPEPEETPWHRVFQNGQPCTGTLYDFLVSADERRTLLTNASPIAGPEGDVQGVLISLEDVTDLELKKRELNASLNSLREKSAAIHEQNVQLEKLATTDPLTECLNRRAFFERFERFWEHGTQDEAPLACVMIDIDFFKSINDNFGHSTGDDVLQAVAGILRETARETGLVCRFGGEEFCALLPHTEIDTAEQVAESFRTRIESREFAHGPVTASLGVSARSLGAADGQAMIDQADKCLYVAKRNGRNQVVRYDQVPADVEVDESTISREQTTEEPRATVPFRAVTALLSTLAFRHSESAAHCRRVADLCVAAGSGVLSPRETYHLEIASLLHDMGKISVPDAILLKAGPLTQQERTIMRTHDRIGVEMVQSAFDYPPVTEIIANYRLPFADSLECVDEETRSSLSKEARLLAIADAWDSMTTDCPYRPALTREQAAAELRQAAGRQFDPDLVERFIFAALRHNREEQTSGSLQYSRDVALDIGQQLERLIDAFEHQDLTGMRSIAGRLQQVTSHAGLPEFAQQAGSLHHCIEAEADLLEILESAQDLIDMCRSTYSTWTQADPASIDPVAAGNSSFLARRVVP